ncbi:MAG: class I SAM-dependent methyltransferase [Promethearchaeota archaeon]
MVSVRLTRGFGLFEDFLSQKRMKIAKNLIKKHNKSGSILDIGCGSYPLFLINSNFNEKYGIDKEILDVKIKHLNLSLIKHDIHLDGKLPFQHNFFDVITILAVIEHLEYNQIYKIVEECYSKLKKNGILIITTPAKWSNYPLKLMAKLYLVSPEEIKEHKNAFRLSELNQILLKANFKQSNIQKGYFEFFLNLWICAKK